MKSKLLPILLVLLILLNGALIFMLINKPHEKRQGPQRNFIAKELSFSEEQILEFRNQDRAHKQVMKDIDYQIRKKKDILFKSLSDVTINIDSITKLIGGLEAKREIEVFRFFSSVRKICTEEQQNKFDKIIKKALKGGQKGPPREGRMPHPK